MSFGKLWTRKPATHVIDEQVERSKINSLLDHPTNSFLYGQVGLDHSATTTGLSKLAPQRERLRAMTCPSPEAAPVTNADSIATTGSQP
jgi:hypothetical protein